MSRKKSNGTKNNSSTSFLFIKNFFSKVGDINQNKFLKGLKEKKVESFYDERQKYTNLQTLGKIKKTVIKLDKMIRKLKNKIK